MSKIESAFSSLRLKGEKALVLFLTAGDQPLSDLPAILDALVEGGADLIEIGIPFSDPFGEGPTIQQSSQRSLDNGTTPLMVLEAMKKWPKAVPLISMGYYNPVLRMGLTRFAELSADAGFSGTIISDLVPDEGDSWVAASKTQHLDTIFLAAPTSTEKRIIDVAKQTTGFVYAVSRTGVTGAENQVPPDVSVLVNRIRAHTEVPICVGFGISTPEHVKMVCEVADGAVVGSFLVSLLHREWNGGSGREKVIQAVKALKAATHG